MHTTVRGFVDSVSIYSQSNQFTILEVLFFCQENGYSGKLIFKDFPVLKSARILCVCVSNPI